MGTIPALVITNNNDDDFVISESQVILEYLDQKFPHTKPLFLASIILLLSLLSLFIIIIFIIIIIIINRSRTKC